MRPIVGSPGAVVVDDTNGDAWWLLDFHPAPGGTPGQVVRVDVECASWDVLAPSWTQLWSATPKIWNCSPLILTTLFKKSMTPWDRHANGAARRTSGGGVPQGHPTLLGHTSTPSRPRALTEATAAIIPLHN